MNKTYDGLPIDLYIHRLKAEQEKWGNLAKEPIQRDAVLAIISYYEQELVTRDGAYDLCMQERETVLQKLNNELTIANRQKAAALARETKCKNELKKLKEE